MISVRCLEPTEIFDDHEAGFLKDCVVGITGKER